MDKFIFKNKEIGYSCNWLDKNTFIFEFGDGEFIDDEDDIFLFIANIILIIKNLFLKYIGKIII